jgi:hypothetical protein
VLPTALAARTPSPGQPYLFFITTRLLSQAAKALFFAALFLAAATEGGLGVLSGIAIAMLLAAILTGVPAGALVDRLAPGTGLALGVLLRAITIGATFAVLDRPELVPLIAFAYSAVSQIYSSAEFALVREVEHECHGRAHASMIAVQYLGHGVALLLGPALYWLGGSAGLLTGALVLYVPLLGAALLLARLVRTRHERPHAAASRRIDLTRGLRFLTAEPRAGYAFGVLAFADLATRVLLVVLPVYVIDEMAAGTAEAATLAVAAGAGALGGLMLGARIAHLPAALRAMRGTLLATPLAVLVLAGNALPAPGALVLALPSLAMLGAAFSLAPIAARTVFSRAATPGAQAQAFSTQASLNDLVVIGPLLLAVGAAELLGARFALLLLAGVALLLLPALEGWLARRPAAAPAAKSARSAVAAVPVPVTASIR